MVLNVHKWRLRISMITESIRYWLDKPVDSAGQIEKSEQDKIQNGQGDHGEPEGNHMYLILTAQRMD